MNLSERQAAKVLDLSVQTLRNWRHLRKGPKYQKLGRSVKYNLDDLKEYMRDHTIKPSK